MADPVGGREAEIEAALANIRAAMDPKVPGHLGLLRDAESMLTEVLRSSGSAAQNHKPCGPDCPHSGRLDCALCEAAARSPQDEDHLPSPEDVHGILAGYETEDEAARSPQDEDHEEKP